MLKYLKISVPALLVIAGLGISNLSTATPAYTKKEQKGCTYCHLTAGKKDLNDVGKCYAEHDHSLSACSPKS